LPYEIELLADSYKTTQEYENSSLLYKALIKNNLINQKIILNYFESLIKADKLAEALYFNAIIKDKIQRVLKYTIASNLLKKKILTFLDEKNSPKKIQNTDKKTKSGYITFTNKQITEDSDKIIGLISKQQDLPFFKNESKYYYDKEPDTQFFIDEIVFSD
jgi:superfamily II helicase